MLHNRLSTHPEIFSLLQPSSKIGQILSSLIGQTKWLYANQIINLAKIFKLLLALTYINKSLHFHNMYLLYKIFVVPFPFTFLGQFELFSEVFKECNLSCFQRFSRNCKPKMAVLKSLHVYMTTSHNTQA